MTVMHSHSKRAEISGVAKSGRIRADATCIRRLRIRFPTAKQALDIGHPSTSQST